MKKLLVFFKGVEAAGDSSNVVNVDKNSNQQSNTRRTVKRRTVRKVVGGVGAVVLIAAGVLYACHKDANMQNSSLRSHKLMTYYDESLVNQFMEEPLVQEFTSCIESFEIEVYNGILHFRNESDVEIFYDTLVYFSDRWDKMLEENPTKYAHYIESEKFPNYPLLFAFEVITNFHSLRADIENQILELEAGEGIPEENNPDDHFIASPYMRTLLTPDYEVIAGKTIFITGDQYTVEIDNLNMDNLQQTQYLIHTFGEDEGMKKACLQGYATQSEPIHKSGGCCERIMIVAEPICGDLSCKFSILNHGFCSIEYVQWYFGDGNQSANIDWYPDQYVMHYYQSKGSYTVKAIITFDDGTSCTVTKDVAINKDCAIEINKFVEPGNNGTKVTFTVLKKSPICNNSTMDTYVWDFGDGTPSKTEYIPSVTHTFPKGFNKTVKVTVTHSDGCKATATVDIKTSGTPGDCCQARDSDYGEREVQYSTCSNKSIIHQFSVRNGPLWHRIVVHSVHREKSKNGKNWNRAKADELFVSYDGDVWDKQCDKSWHVNWDKRKTKAIEITLDHYGNQQIFQGFRIKRNSVNSFYMVKSGSCSTGSAPQFGISLHNKPCN